MIEVIAQHTVNTILSIAVAVGGIVSLVGIFGLCMLMIFGGFLRPITARLNADPTTQSRPL